MVSKDTTFPLCFASLTVPFIAVCPSSCLRQFIVDCLSVIRYFMQDIGDPLQDEAAYQDRQHVSTTERLE